MLQFFVRFFRRSKNREAIKLHQSTPEVQKNPRNWKYSANEIIRIKNWANQSRDFGEFSSGSSVNPPRARYGGTITVLTYVWHYRSSQGGHTWGSFYSMPHGCITYVRGTPAVYSAPPECPVAVQLPVCFYFLWINFKKFYCCTGGTENCDTTCRLLV